MCGGGSHAHFYISVSLPCLGKGDDTTTLLKSLESRSVGEEEEEYFYCFCIMPSKSRMVSELYLNNNNNNNTDMGKRFPHLS